MCISNFYNNNKLVKTLNNKNSLLLKPSDNLKLIVKQFNNTSPEGNTDPENVVKSKYYDIDELQNMKIPNKGKSLVLFHVNACSLNKDFDYLQHLLSCTNELIDIITITKTRITKNVSLTNNLTMNNYPYLATFFILLISYHINLAKYLKN